MKRAKVYHHLGILGALALPGLAVAAVEIPNVFSAGDPVSSSAMNENFSSVGASIEALQTTVASLQGELDEARSAAGYITLANGASAPYFRKVVKLTRTGAITTVPHGISGSPATERRFIGCEVTRNYDSNGPRQTVNLNSASGASTAEWCDMDDTNLVVSFYNATEAEFLVSLLYTAEPF